MNILFEDEIRNFKETIKETERERISDNIIRYLRSKKIYIYGGGATGTTLTAALKSHGIVPFLIIDRRFNSIREINGCRVDSPESLSKVDVKNSLVIIAINAEVIRNFNNETYLNIDKFCHNIDLIEVGADITNILNYVKCSEKLRKGDSFNLVNCLNCGAETRNCSIYNQYLRKISKKSSVMYGQLSLNFDWFGYIMGQHCTLKCKHCCEHVPYLKNKKFSSPEVIISDCRKIANACEFIKYIELIGGEPFLHPNLVEVVKALLEIENVGYIKMFTNGTIVPDKEMVDLLKNPRVVLNFSNYEGQVNGKLAENIQMFKKILFDERIDYIFSESKIWTDWGDFNLRNRTNEQTAYNASHCFIYNCHRVYNGILYRCPHQYAGIEMGYIEDIEGEYVDLNKTSDCDLGVKLEAFENLPFTEACKRCDMPFECPEVPAAVQL